jgi:hypothetical protein
VGGLGSGSWSRYGKRVSAQTCYTIDINSLLQKGALRPGAGVTITWSEDTASGASGEISASIGIIISAPCDIALIYTATDSDGSRDHAYIVPLVWVDCHFGGRRPYFICPGVVNNVPCHHRVAKLYKPQNRSLFLCRHCHNLTYSSCNESGDVHFTAVRRTKRAAQKLGLSNPEEAYTMDRPKGMHKRTFKRRRQEVLDAMDREHRAYYIAMSNFVKKLH